MRIAVLAVAVAVAGCGITSDGAGRVRLPAPMSRCSVVVDDRLSELPNEKRGPRPPGNVTGMVCDAWKW